jgi:hypothetical protein
MGDVNKGLSFLQMSLCTILLEYVSPECVATFRGMDLLDSLTKNIWKTFFMELIMLVPWSIRKTKISFIFEKKRPNI